MTTDTGIVERVAAVLKSLPIRDMSDPGGELDQLRLRETARAVLECLRTPTPEMVEAMIGANARQYEIARRLQTMSSEAYRGSFGEATPPEVALVAGFTAAIDRALSPSKGEGE